MRHPLARPFRLGVHAPCEIRIQQGRVVHRVRYHQDHVTFLDHRPEELPFLAAIETRPCGCVDLFLDHQHTGSTFPGPACPPEAAQTLLWAHVSSLLAAWETAGLYVYTITSTTPAMIPVFPCGGQRTSEPLLTFLPHETKLWPASLADAIRYAPQPSVPLTPSKVTEWNDAAAFWTKVTDLSTCRPCGFTGRTDRQMRTHAHSRAHAVRVRDVFLSCLPADLRTGW
jgi:hypothetical protein